MKKKKNSPLCRSGSGSVNLEVAEPPPWSMGKGVRPLEGPKKEKKKRKNKGVWPLGVVRSPPWAKGPKKI